VALLVISNVGAQGQSAPQVLRIVKGKSVVVTFPERIKTISIADEEIIDVVSITPTDATVGVVGPSRGNPDSYQICL
jgi:Flp pilus assembly secretin CpaC